MSKRSIELSSPNKKFASVRATSVLPTPVGPRKQERTHGPLRILEPGPRAANGARHDLYRGLLSDDALVQLVFHVDELVELFFLDRVDRNPRPGGHDPLDVFPADDRRFGLVFFVGEPRSQRLEALAFLLLLIAIVRRLFEFLGVDGAVDLFGDLLQSQLDFLQLRRRRGGSELHPRTGLIQHINRLVGQETVADIAIGLIHRAGDGLIVVDDAVVLLVALAEPVDDAQRLCFARRVDLHALESPRQSPVLLDVLAVLLGSRCADALQFTARQRRLENSRRIQRALCRARPDQRMELIDKDENLLVVDEFLHDALEALFELSAVLGPRDHRRDVQRQDALVVQEPWHVTGDDLARQSLDDCGLADPGLADQHRIVLGATAQDLDGALELFLAADQRVEKVLGRHGGEISRKLGQERRVLLLLGEVLFLQQVQQVLASGGQAHSLFQQDARCQRLLLAQQAQKNVLRADVLVEHLLGFLRRIGEDALGFHRQRDLDRRGDLLANPGPGFDLAANFLGLDLGPGQELPREPVVFADEAQQEMLGLDGT